MQNAEDRDLRKTRPMQPRGSQESRPEEPSAVSPDPGGEASGSCKEKSPANHLRQLTEAKESPAIAALIEPLPPELLTSAEKPESPETVQYRSYDERMLKQDDIATPAPIPIAQEAARAKLLTWCASCAPRVVVGLCLVISLASLILNGTLIYRLMVVQQVVMEGLDEAIAALGNLSGTGVQYDYHFEQMIPFSGDIPFKQDLVFPFKGNIPINTTVRVPIDVGPLGTFVVAVPINTSVHIETSIPVHVDQTVHVSTTIPLSLTIPIDIKADKPPLRDVIDRVREWLMRLRKSL